MINWSNQKFETSNWKPRQRHWAQKLSLILALAFISGAAWITPVQAQTSTANIEGTVVDPTGAVVPGASITVSNVATGLTRETISNDSGFYNLPLLPVGEYKLAVEKQGFKKKVLQGITLKIDQIARIDVSLEVGLTVEEVTVTAQAPLVNTASTAIGDVIENRRVVELPLNGRYFTQLALLVTGSAPAAQSGAHEQWATNSGGLGFSVAGQRETQNNFNLDGVTLVEHFIRRY